MIRSTLATLLTVVACTPPAPAPSPGPTQPERAIIEARRPPIEADEVQPTEPPEPVAEPWTADRLAPFVKPSCYWAHTTKASRVRASTCFGADVLELPLVRTREVAKSACAGEACDDGPPLALVDHDLACWRDQQRPDETHGAGPERCDCDHVALVAGEPMLFCRRQWLDGDPFTTVVLYRLRDSRWTLALERTVRGYDLEKGETADLQIWVAGDELLLLGSKCALPNRPGSIAARICEHAGSYGLRDGELLHFAPQPKCAAGLMAPPPTPRRRAWPPPAAIRWYYGPSPAPLPPSTGLAHACPATDDSR